MLKSVPAVFFVVILGLSFGVVPSAGQRAAPNAASSSSTLSTGVTIDIHVLNQYGIWYNGAQVDVFEVIAAGNPPSVMLAANGTTVNGEFQAKNVTPYSTYLIQVYTPAGGQANQTVTVSGNDFIVNFVIPSSPAPTLSLQNVDINASGATPGVPFTITAEVVNTSNSTAFNTIISITPPPQFSLLNTGSSISVGTLLPGASKGLNLLLTVSSVSATPGYAISYILNFTDYSGVSYRIPGSISLPPPPTPDLVIQGIVLNPTVIQPGSTFSISAVVVNSGNSTAFNTFLTLLPPAQFSLLGTTSVVALGTIQPGESKPLALQVIVSNTVAPAANTIGYSLGYTDYFLNKQTTVGSIFVPVSGNPVSPKLIVTTATFSSSAIHPGDNFTVPIVIENVGNVPASEVVLSVNATTPLVNTGSAGDYRLGVISGNGTISVQLGFSSPATAPLGSFPIVLTLAYQDTFGTIYSSQQQLVATIVGRPNLVFNLLQFKNNPLTPGLQTFLNAQILNGGGESALNVKVSFQDAPSFLGNTTIFLGSIQPSVIGNATAFLQIPANTSVGAYQFNGVVSYTDSAGRSYQVVAPYTVTVAPFSPPKVSVTNTLLSPAVLNPGTQGILTIYVRNDGASPASNLTLTLLNGSSLFTSNYFGLGTLDQSTSGTTTVGVNVSPYLKGGVYLVQILASYTDQNGAKYNSTVPLQLTVYASTSILSLRNIGIGLVIVLVIVAVYVGVVTRRKRLRTS